MWKRRKLTTYDRCFIVLAIIYLSFFSFPSLPVGATPTVEVEAGPSQDAGDVDQVEGCFQLYKEKFPLDIFAEPPQFDDDGSCPTLDIFGSAYEFCQPLEVWDKIKPVVFIVSVYQAVLLL